MTHDRKQHIAVIGAGGWGKNLIRNFRALGVLKTVCDIDEQKLNARKKDFPDITYTRSYETVLADTSIQGVVIATPAVTHYELAQAALAAKKHVFVEKPLSLHLNEAEELIARADKEHRILMVGHILRYHPAVIKLKELIAANELGRIQYVYSNRLNIGKIRTEENILWSFAPHDISVILFLLDEMPLSVTATGGNYLQEEITDVTLTTLDFPSGIKGHIFVSWLHPFKEQKLVVVGDKQMAVFDDIHDEKLRLYPHKIEWEKGIPVAHKAAAQVVQIDKAEPLKFECQHFLDCIAQDTQPRTDGHEGLRVLKILNAAQQSLNKDGIMISLDAQRNNVFVHPTASVDKDARIGAGTKIWHHSQVLGGAQIGENCVIGHNCFVGGRARLGNGVKLETNIDVWDLVTLEDHVFVGPSVVFTNDLNPRSQYPKKKYPQYGKWIPTVVKQGASIGANATIVCGITIGRHAMIGAGAVVTRDVPDYAIVVGTPAQVVGWMCECGGKLTFKEENSTCSQCDRQYRKKENKVQQIK
ncbi:MAG: Gfo/Idh/MocA family oxidoreductase [candidate division WOR-3 bacterium]|nr:MAG: Gfo/Idh/MocA family oxidoreductase [candidate division WOR-3 bacterium]